MADKVSIDSNISPGIGPETAPVQDLTKTTFQNAERAHMQHEHKLEARQEHDGIIKLQDRREFSFIEALDEQSARNQMMRRPGTTFAAVTSARDIENQARQDHASANGTAAEKRKRAEADRDIEQLMALMHGLPTELIEKVQGAINSASKQASPQEIKNAANEIANFLEGRGLPPALFLGQNSPGTKALIATLEQNLAPKGSLDVTQSDGIQKIGAALADVIRDKAVDETLGQGLIELNDAIRLAQAEKNKLEDKIQNTGWLSWSKVSGELADNKKDLESQKAALEVQYAERREIMRRIELSQKLATQAEALEQKSSPDAEGLANEKRFASIQILESGELTAGSRVWWLEKFETECSVDLHKKLVGLSEETDSLNAEALASLAKDLSALEGQTGAKAEFNLALDSFLAEKLGDSPHAQIQRGQILCAALADQSARQIGEKLSPLEGGNPDEASALEICSLIAEQAGTNRDYLVTAYKTRFGQDLNVAISRLNDAGLDREGAALLNSDQNIRQAGALRVAFLRADQNYFGAMQQFLLASPDRQAELNQAAKSQFGEDLTTFMQDQNPKLYVALKEGDRGALAAIAYEQFKPETSPLSRYQGVIQALGVSDAEFRTGYESVYARSLVHPVRQELENRLNDCRKDIRDQLSLSIADANTALDRAIQSDKALKIPLAGAAFAASGAHGAAAKASDADLAEAETKRQNAEKRQDEYESALKLARIADKLETEATNLERQGQLELAAEKREQILAALNEANDFVSDKALVIQSDEHKLAMRQLIQGLDDSVVWCDNTSRNLRAVRKGAYIVGAMAITGGAAAPVVAGGAVATTTTISATGALGILGATALTSNALEGGLDVAYGNKRAGEALKDAAIATAGDAVDILVTRGSMAFGGMLARGSAGVLARVPLMTQATTRIGGSMVAGGATNMLTDATYQGIETVVGGRSSYDFGRTFRAGAVGTVGGALGGSAERMRQGISNQVGRGFVTTTEYVGMGALGFVGTEGDMSMKIIGAAHGMAATKAGEMYARGQSASTTQTADSVSTNSEAPIVSDGNPALSPDAQPASGQKSWAEVQKAWTDYETSLGSPGETVSLSPEAPSTPAPKPVDQSPEIVNRWKETLASPDTSTQMKALVAERMAQTDTGPIPFSSETAPATQSGSSPWPGQSSFRRRMAIGVLAVEQALVPVAGVAASTPDIMPATETGHTLNLAGHADTKPATSVKMEVAGQQVEGRLVRSSPRTTSIHETGPGLKVNQAAPIKVSLNAKPIHAAPVRVDQAVKATIKAENIAPVRDIQNEREQQIQQAKIQESINDSDSKTKLAEQPKRNRRLGQEDEPLKHHRHDEERRRHSPELYGEPGPDLLSEANEMGHVRAGRRIYRKTEDDGLGEHEIAIEEEL